MRILRILYVIILYVIIFKSSLTVFGQTDSSRLSGEITDTCLVILNSKDTIPINCNCFAIFSSVDGSIYKHGLLRNCLEEGKWIYYGDSSIILKVTHFTLGKRNGEYIKFWSNGKISIKCSFENDLYHGAFESFDPNGNPIDKISYDHGKVLSFEKYKEWQPDGVISYKWFSDTLKTSYKNTILVDSRKAGVYIWQEGESYFLRNLTPEELRLNVPSMDLNKIALEYFYISND